MASDNEIRFYRANERPYGTPYLDPELTARVLAGTRLLSLPAA